MSLRAAQLWSGAIQGGILPSHIEIASATRKVNHCQLENPTGEITGGAKVDSFGEVGTFSNSAERDAAPQEEDRGRDYGDGGKECEKAEWICQQGLPELEPDGISEAGGQAATWTGQVSDEQEVAWRQPELRVCSVADRRCFSQSATARTLHAAASNVTATDLSVRVYTLELRTS